jgi:ribosomal protein L15
MPPVKILGGRRGGGGALPKRLAFTGVAVSGGARNAIEEAGGTVKTPNPKP